MRRRFAVGLLVATLAPTARAQAEARAGVPPPSGALRLTEAIQSALSQGPRIGAAGARVRAAEGARRTARALPNPLLTWQVENGPHPGAAAPAAAARETSTFATLPLGFLYQRGPQLRRADDNLRLAEAELAAARWLVVLDVTRAFGRVLAAQNAVAAAAGLREGLDELARFNAARVAEGATPEGELIRVRVERDRAFLEEALAQTALASSWADLRPFVPSATLPLPPVTLGGSAPAEVPPLPGLLAWSRASQPDILAARARVEASRAAADFERRLLVRDVAASFGNKRVGGLNTMFANLSVSVPVFDRNRGEVARAEAERLAVEQELAWTERRVAAQVEAAHEAAAVMVARLAELPPDLLERAEESRRITSAAYREGAGSLLQVLDASRALAELRQTYGRALLAREQSLLELRAATGGDPLEGMRTMLEGNER